jgi:preprotein translocase subunit YajC
MWQRAVLLISAAAAVALPAAAAGAGPAGPSLLTQLLFFVPLILIFYFLLIRPQQQRAKKHSQMVANIKRGDVIVTSGGLIGKVNKVSDTELSIDLADNVRVRVVRSMVMDVRSKADPVPAND